MARTSSTKSGLPKNSAQRSRLELVVTDIRIGAGIEQQPRHVDRAVLDGHVQGGVVAVPHRALGIDGNAVREQPAQGDGVVLADRKMQRDMRLQRTPARKAVVGGDGELRLMQLRFRRATAQFGEPLIRGLLQPVEFGVRGQCLRNGTPSLQAPGDRITGRKEGDVSVVAEKAV